MAGDWIKMAHGLGDKPEVWQIAGILNIDPDSVVGKLHRVWCWFDLNTEDGNAFGVTFTLVDRVTGVAGFGEAMFIAGWLNQQDKVLSLPNFERHNGKSAKRRALTNERVARHRNAEANAESVTKSVTREEKRRVLIHPVVPRKRGTVFEFPPGFDRFWSAYPRKQAKTNAAKAFARVAPDERMLNAMLAALEVQRASPQWQRDGGQFIPMAATWLNGRRWEDESSTAAPAAAWENAR